MSSCRLSLSPASHRSGPRCTQHLAHPRSLAPTGCRVFRSNADYSRLCLLVQDPTTRVGACFRRRQRWGGDRDLPVVFFFCFLCCSAFPPSPKRFPFVPWPFNTPRCK